jgi:hypothetical protein
MALLDFLRGPKVLLQGYNGAIVNATEEDISDASALLVMPTTAVKLEVASSDNTNDVATTGTGAWTLRVYGLDAKHGWQTEDFIMAGQTPVVGTKSWLCVLGAEVLTAGTTGSNTGTINVCDEAVTWTAGAPSGGGIYTKAFAQIAIAHGNSHNGFYCVPAGERYCLTWVHITNRAQIVDYRVLIEPYGGVATRIPLSLQPATSPYDEINFPFGSVILESKTRIRIMGSAVTTGGVGAVLAVLTRMPKAT